MLEALAARGPVTLLTLEPCDLIEVDRYYGTTLAQRSVKNVVVRPKLLDLVERLPVSNAFLRVHLLMREARRYARDYELVCSAFGELDLGVPCIEYTHFPWNYFPRPDTPAGWDSNPILKAGLLGYRWFCQQLSGFDPAGRRDNLILVNSAWTGRRSAEVYPGAHHVVLHPPALAEPVEDDGQPRLPRFLSIGRCSPEKEWLKLIDIVEGLRREGHEVGLTLAGSRHHEGYSIAVEQRARQAGAWVDLVFDFSREQLQQLMRTHRYGIHGMQGEHYGMAVAELLLGGCLTMVHDSGGQVEIVTNPRLHYSDVEDAVAKWKRVLDDPSLEAELLRAQRAHLDHLGKARFLAQFNSLVDSYLAARRDGQTYRSACGADPSVLFAQPSLAPPGGGNGVAAWMLDTLARRGPVMLLTAEPFDAVSVDSYYGTNLAQLPVRSVVHSPAVNEIVSRLPGPTGLLQTLLITREFRKRAASFDLVFTAYDEVDLGQPCVEYVHFPWNYFPRPDAPPHWNENRWLKQALRVYRRLCTLLADFHWKRRARNLTLVNSAWTGRLLDRVYPGTGYRVLHPPALSERLDDHSRRAPRFLTIGRLAPAKELLKLVEIIERLRGRGHDVGLTLAGSLEPQFAAYVEQLRELARDGRPWLDVLTDLDREEMREQLLTHEFGLHGMKDEHYGMGVAELVLGGCLTMVPNDGGQTEIVTDPRLRYDSVDDAVEKLHAMLAQAELRSELWGGQQQRREHLTKERFVREFDGIVAELFDATSRTHNERQEAP